MRHTVRLLLIFAFASAALAQCIPGPGQVAVFKHSDYDGTCRVLTAGNYPSPRAMGFPNDEMSSVRIGPNAQVLLCEHDNYGGRCETFTADDSNFGNNPIRHDRVSSARVTAGPPQTCEPGANQVSIFEDPNHSGLCVTLSAGEYRDPLAMGFPNDKLTSIKVGSAVEALLCIDADYLRDCQLFNSTQANLTGTRIGNDTVTSMLVRPRGAAPCLPARNQVAVYTHRDFEMPCSVKAVGEYATPFAMGILNDSTSSARVGADVQLVACVNTQYLEDCERFTGDVADFGRTRVADNRISSMKVQSRGVQDCVPQDNQASLFAHVGNLAPCVVKGTGNYGDDAAIGLPHDSISSLRVGAKVQVCACLDSAFHGNCETFTANDVDLRDNFTGKGNDAIGSVRVQVRGAVCKTEGYRAIYISNCSRKERDMVIWWRDAQNLSAVWRLVGTATWLAPCGPSLSFDKLPPDGVVVELAAVDSGVCEPAKDPSWPGCLHELLGQVLIDRAGQIAKVQVR